MTPYYEHAGITIYHGDCREILPQIETATHMFTDPPYSDHVHRSNRKGLTAHAGKISDHRELGFDSLTDDERIQVGAWCATSVDRWCGIFSDTESDYLWREALLNVEGLEYVRTAFWHKVGGAPQFTGDRPAVALEAITLAHRRGRKRWNGGGRQGLYSVPIVCSRGGPNEVRVHSTQKPLALMQQIVADFTDVGDVIIDPFIGSGTTLVAAKMLGRRGIGIERKEQFCELSAQRLSQDALPLYELSKQGSLV